MGAEMDAAVQVADLVKRYPGRPVDAVAGISFTVGRGEVFGLLGPNGAGRGPPSSPRQRRAKDRRAARPALAG